MSGRVGPDEWELRPVREMREFFSSDGPGWSIVGELARSGADDAPQQVVALVRDFANAIEAHVGTRYMRLPVGADGSPIRVNDVMVNAEGEVLRVASVGEDRFFVYGDLSPLDPKSFSHVRRPTLEGLLMEFMKGATGQDEGIAWLAAEEYAERIRRLVEEEE